MFNKLASKKTKRVPYKATPQVLVDVASGRVHMMFPALAQALTRIEAAGIEPE